MELSSLDSTQSPPKSNNNVMDTPRTSNLKFLRAKRLNYFCGKSSQNPLSKTEESQNVGQTMKTATPRRCLPASTSNHVTADNNVPKNVNAEATTMSPNREKSLDATEEAKPPSSTSPQDKHANPGKDHLTDSPAPRTLHPTTTEMEVKEHTKHHNLQSVAEISCEPNKSIPNSLQLKISNPPVPSIQHSLQPVTKKKAKDMLTQHGLQEVLEKSGGNVLFADNILQSSDKEPKIKGSPTYYDPLDTPKQVKERKYLSTKTESDEVDVLSTHRNLLRSSFVTDLDQDYLEDLSVPEREKLQHVMTWAKKFLDKCGDGKLISRNGDTLSKNMDEDISFECTGSSRVTDKYLKLNSVVFDEYEFKKHPCIGDEPMESAPGQLLKSPRSLYKPKSKRKTAQLDSFLAEPTSNFRHCDHKELDSFSASPCSVFPKLVKNMDVKNAFNIKGDDCLREQFFDSTKQGHMHSDDLFGIRTKPNQSHFNTHTFKDTKPGPALKDSYIDREEDSSSPDSCLDTERLNILLEDLEWIEKDLKKTGENDGARTDRTFLVKNNAQDDDCTYISVSGKIPDSLQPALPRVESSSSLSESYTRKIYHMCPACGFTNTTSSNWCTECGSAFKRAKKQPMVNNRSFELSKPHTDDRAADEIFSLNPQRKSFANNTVSKQNATELGRAVCWEDNSDVASDSEGSVLEKYFFYVKQLDMLRSQEKENPTKHFQEQHNSETSSDDESSDDYSIPRVRSGPAKPWGEPETLGTDPYRLGDQAIKEDSLKGFSEHINGNEGSNLKALLDRKLQKAPDISSKVTGPRRYWEKSSIPWSSYTHGELKPRSRHSIQRPTSADFKKNKNQTQADNDTEINAASKVERFIQKENNCTANATEYKNVAVAYMTTSNAWAVSEHLCKNKWERSTQNHQRMCEGENSSVWLLLPDELWIYIFSQLSHGDLSRVARVCQRFRYIANDNSLWKVIKVTNCHLLEDSSLVSIGLHHPESISLYRCHDDRLNITDAGFRKLFQHCKDSLKKLNITNCSGEIFKGDSVLSYASNYCTRLISVDISWTGATDKGIISLVQACTCLQSLSMNGCNITDNAITALLKRHCKSLIKLEIFGCHALTAKCLTSVATECVHLENLNIGRIPKATDVCLAKIASNLHKITTLNLTGLNVVRDRAVHHIVKQCSKLESLSLSSCLQVTDVSLVEISTYRTTIKYLDLSGCKKVSDIGVQALARSCLQLRYLDLSSTSTGKRGVCLLASYCYATLECLKLSFCKEVTADAIEKLCKNCKRLKVLHLYGCRVSPDLGYLKKFSKSFQILHDLSIPTANILGE